MAHPSAAFFRSGLLLLALALAATAAAAASPSTARKTDTGDPTLALSPLEIKAETMEFSRWLRLTSPHFILYTDAGTKDAALTVRHLEMLHQAAQFFLHRQALNLPPTIVVLPTARSDWNKIGSRGGVKWDVAASLLSESRTVLLVQYDWQHDGLASVHALLGAYELDLTNLRGPLWFSRGIADFFRTVTFEGDSLTIGKQGFDGYWIKQYGWMNWPRFFGVTHASPEYVQDSRDHDVYEAQCGVFVHYLLSNQDPAATERLLGWVAYLHAGNAPTEEAFKEVFKVDWKTFQTQVEKLFDGGKYTTGNIHFPPAALQFPVTTDSPPAREMRDLFVLSQIQNQDTPQSRDALDALLKRGLGTESLRELLADACLHFHRDEALPQLRSLIASGSTNPLVYTSAAELVMNRLCPVVGPKSNLGEATAEIKSWCTRACELEPLLPEANEQLAFAEALGPTVQKDNLDAIARICRRLDAHAPTDKALAALAIARLRAGNAKSARALATQLAASPFSRETAKRIAGEIVALPEETTATKAAANLP